MQDKVHIYRRLSVILLFLTIGLIESKAQRLAVSTNLVDYVTLSPNLELDLSLNQHNSISLSASVTPWNVYKNFSITQLSLSPEYKHWFKIPYYGHYVGANIKVASYEIMWGSNVLDATLLAAGVTYGYSIIISKKWNIVPNIGLGLGANFEGSKIKLVPAITKFGLNIQMVVR